jgi:hypothetical protein
MGARIQLGVLIENAMGRENHFFAALVRKHTFNPLLYEKIGIFYK